MFVRARGDNPISRKRGRTAIGVMHDDDILDAKKMLRHCDRAERIDGAPAGHNDWPAMSESRSEAQAESNGSLVLLASGNRSALSES
jgi:hypothetical protein